jgi:hypothetical protein
MREAYAAWERDRQDARVGRRERNREGRREGG